MKLHSLREHFQSVNDQIWKPKRAFNTKEEITEQLGFDTDLCHVYKCSVCDMLHIASLRKAQSVREYG